MKMLSSLALLAAPLSIVPEPAQQVERSEPAPILTVSGTAEVAAKPDRASVTLGASAQAAEAAQAQVNRVLQSALAALKKVGVPEAQIQTTGLYLQPVYSQELQGVPGSPGSPRIVAYRASDTVQVRVDDISLVGSVIDAGIGAGANELQGIAFELKDDTPQRASALKLAMKNARQKAEALAEAAGATLAAIQRIEEGGAGPVPVYSAARMEMQAGTPVQPGEVRVQASVSVTYRLSVPAIEPPGKGR